MLCPQAGRGKPRSWLAKHHTHHTLRTRGITGALWWIVELLHEIKHMRQLIIASHNANLVVNGAAEFVGVMNNDESGRRILEGTGAIDKEAIRAAITTNMEGGKVAFRDRQRKYGF